MISDRNARLLLRVTWAAAQTQEMTSPETLIARALSPEIAHPTPLESFNLDAHERAALLELFTETRARYLEAIARGDDGTSL